MESHMKSEASIVKPSAFEVVSQLVAALAAQDFETMKSLHAKDYVVDWVYGDASQDPPNSAEESGTFFPAWFIGFDEMDFEVKRTIAAEEVVVTEWVFMGTHTGPLGPPVFEEQLDPTGRTIQFRGLTVYDVSGGLIQRETIYMDLATLIVELEPRCESAKEPRPHGDNHARNTGGNARPRPPSCPQHHPLVGSLHGSANDQLRHDLPALCPKDRRLRRQRGSPGDECDGLFTG